jgi:hypothetical protein
MDKKLKAKWVKALRSGKFKQGNGVLYNPNKRTHCCLGVLSQVDGHSTDAIAWKYYPSHADINLLPHEIEREFADLNDMKDETGALIPVPFDMIAGLIEEAL